MAPKTPILPLELWRHIFSFCAADVKQMIAIATVCKQWKSVLDHPCDVIPAWRKLKITVQAATKTQGENKVYEALSCAPLHNVEFLECSYFSDRCAELVMSRCTNLKKIRTENSLLSDDGVAALATPINNKVKNDKQTTSHTPCRFLQELVLEDFFVSNTQTLTDEGAKRIGTNFPFLETLSVSARNLTDQGLASLGQCNKLKSLTLSMASTVTDVGFQKLFQMCKGIEELKITFANNITDAALQHLPPSIRKLKLLVCPKVTKKGVTVIYDRLSLLEELTITRAEVGPALASELPKKKSLRKLSINNRDYFVTAEAVSMEATAQESG